MIKLKTLIMQLIDGRPDGIRICRVEGESLLTLVIPRDLLSEAKSLPDIPKRGVYYLLDENRGALRRVYAGQTTQGISRIDNHKANKDFWNKAIMFLDDHRNIDTDTLAGLEAKAIGYIQTHGDYEADNTVTPNPYIDPYKEAAIERLHASMLFRMAALGYDLDVKDEEGVRRFHTKKRGIRAIGFYAPESNVFTVLAGSEVDLSHDVLKYASIKERRREEFGDVGGIAVLDRDLGFESPSAAAVFVLGGSQNGWTEWVDDEGSTLSAVYRKDEA